MEGGELGVLGVTDVLDVLDVLGDVKFKYSKVLNILKYFKNYVFL
jgi:hypothetical protein